MTVFRLFTLSLLLATTVFFTPTALAETPTNTTPTILVTGAVGYGVSVKSGTAPPPTIIHGVGVLVPITGGWSYYGEVAGVTTFTELKLGLVVTTGPVKKLGDRVSIGVTTMYKMQPVYDGASQPMHILGLAAAPILKTSFGAVSFPMGAAYNASTNDLSAIFVIKGSVRL